MEQKVVGFIPPVIGTEGEFNTFRLGLTYARTLSPGDEVLLLNEKAKIVFGRARVERIETGCLGEMCLLYAHRNHTELSGDPNTAPQHLHKTLCRIYGPHIATPTKKTTVIFMRRLE